MTARARFAPAPGPLAGTVRAPADKSISHRAAIVSAMGEGTVRIDGYLRAADTLATLDAVRALGAAVAEEGDAVVIGGVGLRGARAPAAPIDVHNAGTLLRLLPGWLAGQEGRSFVLDGDASIRRRPVDRIVVPLARMGASIDAREGRLAPLRVTGEALHGIEYELPVASAQVKSAVLLAGLLADAPTTVVEPQPSRDHTERMLAAVGVDVVREGGRVTVRPAAALRPPRTLTIPGDPSSAAFWVAAALLVPGSSIRIENVAANWTRTGFIAIARRMGARIEGDLEAPGSGALAVEPVSALEIRHAPLVGTEVGADEVGLAIDELPLVALLGCFAAGETVVAGAAELRVKESDRIASVVGGLRALGADVDATADGFVVRGDGGLRGGVLESHGDHRLAMLGAIAGLASRDGVEVAGMEAAAVSYPGFVRDLERLRG
jgi:3-phosphoshikimate 1-carboxyvinyltransferase